MASLDWQTLQVAPVRRRKLYQEIVERIEASVLNGELELGAALPSERELMKVFGVGRPAIREALFALERRGFVSISNGETARISQPDPRIMLDELSGAAKRMLMEPSGVRHFQQARILFETGLARHAAKIATKAQLGELEAALQANREALGDQVRFDRTDVAFHFAIAEVARNPIFTALNLALREWLYEQRSVAGLLKGGPDAAYAAHERIFRAIVAKDPNAAGEAMQEHLEEISERYWKLKARLNAPATDEASPARSSAGRARKALRSGGR